MPLTTGMGQAAMARAKASSLKASKSSSEPPPRAACDVLILARGGGWVAGLLASNDEALARAIAACPIPVVSGIGHEIDFTIADFAADVRAATPSAAAEIVVPEAEEWAASFRRLEERLQRALLHGIRAARERLQWIIGRAALVSPEARLAQQGQRLDELEQRLSRALRQILADRRSALGESVSRLWQLSPVARLQGTAARQAALFARLRAAGLAQLNRARARLAPLIRTLDAVSPLATLERGYAIVSHEGGGILRDAAEAAPGTLIGARLSRGRIRARVEGTDRKS